MAVKRLNHAVLYVRDAKRTAAFYRDVLGFRVVSEAPFGTFMQAPDSTNDHDVAFFTIGSGAADSPAGKGSVGLYHLAWEVGTLEDLADYKSRLESVGSLVGSSDHGTSKSLYAVDPDGLEFEVCWVVPGDKLGPNAKPTATPLPLDIRSEIERFGPSLVGGR